MVITPKLAEVYERLKDAARIALKHGVDGYDFRRISAAAIAQAAYEETGENVSAAARRIGMARTTTQRRMRITKE